MRRGAEYLFSILVESSSPRSHDPYWVGLMNNKGIPATKGEDLEKADC